MKNLSRPKTAIMVAVVALVLGVVGMVYAAWTTTGSGASYAKATTAQALTTVDVSASSLASLYPGADGNVLIKVSNPNPYPVRVTGVTGTTAITADSGHATCVVTGVTFANQTGLTIDVPASSSTQTTLNNAAHMSNASDNGCQGATFTIPVSLTGTSNAP